MLFIKHVGYFLVYGALFATRVTSQDTTYVYNGCASASGLRHEELLEDIRDNQDTVAKCQARCRSKSEVFGVKRDHLTSNYVWCYCGSQISELNSTAPNISCQFTCADHSCGGPAFISLYKDKDECLEVENVCEMTANCMNTVGGYSCKACAAGFTPSQTGGTSCVDVDECSINGTCGEGDCTNTFGSYECQCQAGYQLDGDQLPCLDIDECMTGEAECDHDCQNTAGSYSCSCRAGFQLQDTTVCTDIDECMRGDAGCDVSCNNTPGGYTCVCQGGLTSANASCQTTAVGRPVSMATTNPKPTWIVGVLLAVLVFKA